MRQTSVRPYPRSLIPAQGKRWLRGLVWIRLRFRASLIRACERALENTGPVLDDPVEPLLQAMPIKIARTLDHRR